MSIQIMSGDNSPINDETSTRRGVFSRFPFSMPKFVESPEFRLYLPAKDLLKSNPNDKDILTSLVNEGYINLIVTNSSENFSERMEVKRFVNGSFATFFYGMEPPQFSFSGHVLNDSVDDWRNQLLRLYTGYIRGGQLAKAARRLVVSYSDLVLIGECTQINTGLTGSGETHGTFQLGMIVHSMSVAVKVKESSLPPENYKLTVDASSSTEATTKSVKVESNKPTDKKVPVSAAQSTPRQSTTATTESTKSTTSSVVQTPPSTPAEAYSRISPFFI